MKQGKMHRQYNLQLGQNLRFLIRKNRISIASLCRTIGVSSKTVYAYTYGVVPGSVEIVQRIADYFGVNLTDLLFNSIEISGTLLQEKISESISIEVVFVVKHERNGALVEEQRKILLRGRPEQSS